MRSIIIEKSKETIQVVSFIHHNGWTESQDCRMQDCRMMANNLAESEWLIDFDVMFFNTISELNNFLLDNLKL